MSENTNTPTNVLIVGVIGHLVETVDLDALASAQIVSRRFADGPAEGFEPYAMTEDLVPPFARPGDGYRSHTTGLTYLPSGFPTQNPAQASAALARTTNKLAHHRDLIEANQIEACEDVEIVLVAIGICAHAAEQAMRDLRAEGIRAGLFRPRPLCPGCGHGIALRALLWAVHELGIDKDKLAVVSGIGCTST